MPLFRKSKQDDKPAPEHAVITHLPLSDDEYGTNEEREAIHALEHRIEAAVADVGGEHDGDEFGGGEAVLYTYGPDADRLMEAIMTCLGGFGMRSGAYAIKRFGDVDDPDAREERVSLA